MQKASLEHFPWHACVSLLYCLLNFYSPYELVCLLNVYSSLVIVGGRN